MLILLYLCHYALSYPITASMHDDAPAILAMLLIQACLIVSAARAHRAGYTLSHRYITLHCTADVYTRPSEESNMIREYLQCILAVS